MCRFLACWRICVRNRPSYESIWSHLRLAQSGWLYIIHRLINNFQRCPHHGFRFILDCINIKEMQLIPFLQANLLHILFCQKFAVQQHCKASLRQCCPKSGIMQFENHGLGTPLCIDFQSPPSWCLRPKINEEEWFFTWNFYSLWAGEKCPSTFIWISTFDITHKCWNSKKSGGEGQISWENLPHVLFFFKQTIHCSKILAQSIRFKRKKIVRKTSWCAGKEMQRVLTKISLHRFMSTNSVWAANFYQYWEFLQIEFLGSTEL